MQLASSALSPISVAAIVVVVVAAMFVSQLVRRRRADQTAERLGGTVVTGALPTEGTPAPRPSGSIGNPNPALPPAVDPDQRTGVVTSGAPVELSICGLPALVWQRGEHSENHYEPIRLSLIADTAVSLPPLNLYHRSGMTGLAGEQPQAAAGVAELDASFRFAGDVPAWAPVLATPSVQEALLAFPLDSLSVTGGRITLVSQDGVHLDPGATSGIANVAATLIAAVPPQLAADAAPPATDSEQPR